MDFLKKKWISLVNLLCLIGVIIYLIVLSSQIADLEQQNAKIMSTFGSIESVTISSDSSLNAMSQQINKIENNVTYIVKKVRRR